MWLFCGLILKCLDISVKVNEALFSNSKQKYLGHNSTYFCPPSFHVECGRWTQSEAYQLFVSNACSWMVLLIFLSRSVCPRWAAGGKKSCSFVLIERKAPSVELHYIKAELSWSWDFQQQQPSVIPQQDVELQQAASAAPAVQGFGPSAAAILGLLAFSPLASHLISFFPRPTCLLQLFLLQYTFCCAGPLGGKSAFILSIQDPTRQAANSGNDGKELHNSAV